MNDLFIAIGAPPLAQAPETDGANKPSQSGDGTSFQKTLKSYQERRVEETKDEDKYSKPKEDNESKTEMVVPLIQVVVVEQLSPMVELSEDQQDLMAQSLGVETLKTDPSQSLPQISQSEEHFSQNLSALNSEDQADQVAAPVQLPDGSKNESEVEELKIESGIADLNKSNSSQSFIKMETDVEPETDLKEKTKIFQPSTQVVIDTGVVNNSQISEIDLSQLARPAEIKQMDILKQVSNVLDNMVEKGNSTIKLQLFPQDLGKLELTVVSRKNGVEISLVADTPATQRILESDMNNLRQHLTASGIEIANLNIGQSNQQSWTGESQSWQQSKRKHSKVYSTNLNLDGLDLRPILMLNPSGVDYKV